MAALKSRFMNSMRPLQPVERLNAWIDRTRALCVTIVPPPASSTASSAALPRMIVREKSMFLFIFQKLAVMDLQDSQLSRPYLSLRYCTLKINAV
jgi:hypothetical protein